MLATPACVTVRPWERGDLAKMEQQAERCAASMNYEAHFWMVREGAIGGTGAPAGGCGCN